MTSTTRTNKRLIPISGALIVVFAILLTGSLSPAAAATPQQGATGSAGEQNRLKWQMTVERMPVPGKGCFTASYPNTQWLKAQCATPPNRPYPPGPGHRPQTVGNGTDFAAEVTGLMSGATGSFDSVTGVTSETGQVGGVGPQVANTYALQLNTKPFTTPKCSGSLNPAVCQGWEQFLYSNSNGVFIQYWLLNYNTACPAGWIAYSNHCYKNGPSMGAFPAQAITNLASLRLTGTASSGGNDTVVITNGAGNASAANVDSILSLANGWTGVEFVLVGDCCNSQANFNAGSTLVVRTTVHNGTVNAPTCALEGFTGETNNLTLVGTPPIPIGPSPSIVSTQSNVPGTVASCSAAAGIGDPHLTTFGGLLYDFQASGDFVLAQTGPHFIVQTRQVSGAPSWPNAAVNQAVATHIGNTDVALCPSPTPLRINNTALGLADGQQLNLADGGDIFRQGNVYLIRGKSGDSVRVEVNSGSPNWMNVSVGLGRWPTKVHGLLANAGNNANALEARDGTVLPAPVSFKDLYARYGDSWRVPSSQSLLSACGRKVVRANPTRPFTTQDLKPPVYKRARGICISVGVKERRLLDACILDVAVLGERAAAAFGHAPKG